MSGIIQEKIPHFSLWKAYRETHDPSIQENLVKRYMHLVHQTASRLSISIPGSFISKEDLIGLGYIGLMEAIQNFDYKKGYQFETFGLWRIKGAMMDGIRQLDWAPRSFRDKSRKFKKAYAFLEQTWMRAPTVEELSQYLNVSLEQVDEVMAGLSLTTLLSLDEPLPAKGDHEKIQTRLDQIPDENFVNQEKHVEWTEIQHFMSQCIDQLPEKERLVISLFYYDGLTQIEIAESLKLTKGRISQLHSHAILRMRHFFESKGLLR
jgi:RNA polymerase sigma factor FliA